MNSKISYRTLCLGSLMFNVTSLVMHTISFSTPNWLVSDGSSPFQRLGFHEACFDNCHFPYCPGDSDIIFNGCYVWTFNELLYSNDQFREIVDWLLPPWFQTCKVIFITNIVLLIFSCILHVLCTCWAFMPEHTPKTSNRRDLCAISLGFLIQGMLATTTLLNISGLAIFSSIAPHKQYMPMSYKNHFGYSFWMEFCATLIMGFGSFLTYLSTMSIVIEFMKPKYIQYSEDMLG